MDLPGHGGSSKHRTGLNSFAGVGELLLALMDQLKIDQAHFVAHSMGAAVAQSMTKRHPQRAVSLSLISPAGWGATPSPEFLSSLISATTRRDVSAALKMLVADENTVTRQMADDLLKY